MKQVCEACWAECDELFEDEDGNYVCENCLLDGWEDIMPEADEYGITIKDAAKDVAVFLANIVLALLIAALVVAFVSYAFWREVTIMTWFVNQ